MLAQIPGSTDRLMVVIAGDVGRIAWNIFLALIPLTLSFFLFYKPRSKWYQWGIYTLLTFSFIFGIKKYNNGDILVSIVTVLKSLWGVRIFFVTMAIGLIAGLMTIDIRYRSKYKNSRPLAWWIGLFLFILILPNAPYILTDIIHFYDAVRDIDSVWEITLVIVPIYIIFMGIGWFAYLFSLINVGRYLKQQQLDRYINITEISIHLLCAIGIYIGRFIRFNTWSIVTHPKQFLEVLPGELMGKFPLAVILVTFLIITVFYTVSKSIADRLLLTEVR
jgi:uncharacterized membrane protein